MPWFPSKWKIIFKMSESNSTGPLGKEDGLTVRDSAITITEKIIIGILGVILVFVISVFVLQLKRQQDLIANGADPFLQLFVDNRAKWESQHIGHYQMYVSDNGGGELSMPILVEVQDGNVISVVDAEGKKVLFTDEASRSHEHLFSVPGLFSYILETYSGRPPSIQVSYNPALGYPESIYIDPYSEPCCQDFSIDVRDFQILP